MAALSNSIPYLYFRLELIAVMYFKFLLCATVLTRGDNTSWVCEEHPLFHFCFVQAGLFYIIVTQNI